MKFDKQNNEIQNRQPNLGQLHCMECRSEIQDRRELHFLNSEYKCKNKTGKALNLNQVYFKTLKKKEQEEFNRLCDELFELNKEINTYINDASNSSSTKDYLEYLFLANSAIKEAKQVSARLSIFSNSRAVINKIIDDINDIESTIRRMINHAFSCKGYIRS